MLEQFKNLEYSIIGQGTLLKGEIQLDGPTYLLGSIEGSITSKDESIILIGESAKVSGELECSDIEIKGFFSGKINSRGTVKITAPAQVDAQITSKNLVIKPGAKVNLRAKAE